MFRSVWVFILKRTRGCANSCLGHGALNYLSIYLWKHSWMYKFLPWTWCFKMSEYLFLKGFVDVKMPALGMVLWIIWVFILKRTHGGANACLGHGALKYWCIFKIYFYLNTNVFRSIWVFISKRTHGCANSCLEHGALKWVFIFKRTHGCKNPCFERGALKYLSIYL